MSSFEILAIGSSPYMVQDHIARKPDFLAPNSMVAAAASQAGYLGIVDLAFTKLPETIDRLLVVALKQHQGFRIGISQVEAFAKKTELLLNQAVQENFVLTVIVVPDEFKRAKQLASQNTAQLINRLKSFGQIRVLIETISIAEVKIVQKLSADGIIAKGQEASGIVGETTAFVLMQECLSHVKLPVYVWGGIGLHTAPACYVAGASGVILDSQLLLTKESQLPVALKAKIEQFDGTELHVVSLSGNSQITGEQERNKEKESEEGKLGLRVYARSFHSVPSGADQLSYLDKLSIQGENTTLMTIYEHIVAHNVQNESSNWIFPLGQDIAFAGPLAQKYLSVAGILHAIKNSIQEHITLCRKLKPLAAQSSLAQSHGTLYPIVQGAMTRVSDKAEFANEVAQAGGLPFLALALMRGSEAEVLVNEAKTLLKDKPWGVGILGFVPNELRLEQMAVLEKYKPPYVLIAGGRPDQAKHLEDMGIKTYLHVPSPLLLDSFMEMGSKRFIFEGKECGGHVGPRSSFVLWETMIEHLLENIGARENASAYHVIFAGGIHDDRSAAAVATMAAPLAARGVRIGILMGTAYLFTEEVVNSGAIIKKFQEAALGCEQTVLLETGPGHAIRCVDSPYKKAFDKKRQTLAHAGTSKEEIREELELMNLGRLRLASKGLIRQDSLNDLDVQPEQSPYVSSKEKVIAELTQTDNAANSSTANKASSLQQVPEHMQWQHGMYMIGQVASLHSGTFTISQLHENVCQGSTKLLDSLPDSNIQNRQERDRAKATIENKERQEPIAIVGMSCLLPKAKNVETYWSNILNKVDAIDEVPLYQWDWRNYYDPDPLARDKIYSKWGGFLEDIEFDPTKYGIPPSSLVSIDPMQILLLEVTDAALKDAGYDKKPFPREKTSVILANAGHGPITALYSLRSMLGWKLANLNPALKQELEEMLPEWTEDSFAGYLGNVTAGRVANRFDLEGVNFSIDAACASSLAALYTSVSDLRSGNSDVVFLASSDTHNQPGDYLSFSKTHAFSADGHCKTFDSSADGIVISEGMAMLVLKRLSDAERDGDRIYALIKGVGGSSDGRDLSLTAPRPAGQIKALNRAYEDAGINPNTVTLIEAHGTGTVAGDKAEVEALKQVFELSQADRHSCAIGSVKTMIGHTKATAGLASMIKVAKALHHKILPPTIGVKTPNPACHFENGPFYINTESRPWILPAKKESEMNGEQSKVGKNLGGEAEADQSNSSNIRRAGVSAFGFGGTNFHAVLEEYLPSNAQVANEEDPIMPAELFVFTGASSTEVVRALVACADKAKRLTESSVLSELSLAGLAYWQFLKDCEHRGQSHKLGINSRLTKTVNDEQSTEQQNKYCLGIVASSLADLNEKLSRAKEAIQTNDQQKIKDPRGVYYNIKSLNDISNSKLAFLFPGQGSQYPGMLSQLAMRFAEVRQTFAQANTALAGKLDKSLSEYIFPPPSFTKEEETAHKDALTDTRIAQPALGAANMAAKALLMSMCVKPNMVAGHSYGEYVALCAAGYFDFPSLMTISKQRGEILAQSTNVRVPHGAMAAVSCSASELAAQMKLLPSSISIANLNSPGQTVIAGGFDDIEESISILQTKGLVARRIPVSQAFHTKSMKGASEKLETILKEVELYQGIVDVYSNLQGMKYDRSPANIVSKLRQHTVEPVDFVDQIKKMYSAGARIFLEVGPSNVLTNLAQSILEDTDAVCISIDRQGRDCTVSFLHALAQMAVCGVNIDFERLYQYRVFALKQGLNTDQSKSGKKLVYTVNSATAKLKGQVVANSSSKPKEGPAVFGQAKSFASTSNSFNSDRQDKGFGNLKMGNISGNNNTLRSNESPSLAAAINRNNALPNNSTEVSEIMLQFQESMQQMANSFLETQQRVMLAYLSTQKTEGEYSALEQIILPGSVQTTPVHRTMDAIYEQSVPTVALSSNESSDNQQLQVTVGEPTLQMQPDTEQLVNTLLEIVAERTGYPVDMIDPSLDLEADLGIDSIKRVEILNKFRRVLPEEKQKQLESGIEELAGAKTLQSIIDWLRAVHDPLAPQQISDNHNGSHSDSSKEQSQAVQVEHNASGGNGKHENARPLAIAQSPHGGTNGSNSVVKRGVVSAIPLSEQTLTAKQLSERIVTIKETGPLVLITADKWNLSDALGELLAEHGLIPIVLTSEQTHSNNGHGEKSNVPVKTGNIFHYDLDLQNFELTRTSLHELEQKHGPISMLFHLQSFAKKDAETNRASAINLLQVLKYFAMDSSKSGAKQKLITATSMGGKFGHELAKTNKLYSPVQAAVVGLTKVAAKELSSAFCKAVDFDLSSEANDSISSNKIQEIASKLLLESVIDDNNIEVGYSVEKRWGLEIVDGSLKVDFSHAPLNENSVVLITGGARGITADIAMQLAQLYKPILILVGRSILPTESEDARYAGLTSMREIKAKIIEIFKADGKAVNIPDVELRYQNLVRDREIRNNIERLQGSAKKAEYHSLDVRDNTALAKLVEDIYNTYGKIDAVIHGAGIIEDALLKDKDKESFARVFDTKVSSALTLVDSLKLDSLKYLFLFSSVVGRTGNAGQADYVAANEVLNKLALLVNSKLPAGRAAAIMWGPWKGGMAQPELESIFAQYGWAMIDVQKGCQAFVDEMFCTNKKESEVLLVAESAIKKQYKGRGARLIRSEVLTNASGDREYIVELDTQIDAFLLDHAFDGVPVLPMAYALELMCEAASSTYPDLPLKIIESLDIPAGILFDVTKKKISIVVHEEEKQSESVIATVSIISGSKNRRVNFKARFVLGEKVKLDIPVALPTIFANGHNKVSHNNGNGDGHKEELSESRLDLTKADLGNSITLPSIADIYKQWLFHGESFHGMKNIYMAGEKGVIGQVAGRSAEKCLHLEKSDSWIIDPVMFDCAMQLGGIWARKCLDITALPTGFRSLQFHSPIVLSSDECIFVHILIRPPSSNNELRCDMALYDKSGELLMFVEELSGVGSKSLHRLASQNVTMEAGVSG